MSKRLFHTSKLNLTTKQTANLAGESKEITYDYDYNRLTGITYPDNPQNNVKYYYGGKNAPENRRNRLSFIEDAAGGQEFSYGRLGEITQIKRTVIVPNQAIATYITKFTYDSWNRLTGMVYPDGEKLTYAYNLGGDLESLTGAKAYSYAYVNKIGYDKFGQRVYMKYCNGAETNYTYDPLRRRLQNLDVNSTKTGTQILNNAYTYDAVSNVLSVVNSAPVPTAAAGMGGQMAHNYAYDGLYRLISATGTYTGAGSGTAQKKATYSLNMKYDNLHNIVSKKQDLSQANVQFTGNLFAGYDLGYSYDSDKPHQIKQIKDDNYRTEDGTKIAANTDNNTQKYTYDANGNLIYVNTERLRTDSTQTSKVKERKLLWDEENRLTAIDDNGFISNYWYDYSGERVIKEAGGNEGVFVNSVFSGGRTDNSTFTLYVNPYMVVNEGGHYTKHIYINGQRIVSKLGDMDSYGADPRRMEYAGTNVDNVQIDYPSKYKDAQDQVKDNYKTFEVPYLGTDNNDYVNGQGFCCTVTSPDPSKGGELKAMDANIGSGNDNPEKLQYYYHSDHLGSTSLITDLDGNVVQHVEYIPFGEVFLEERNNTWNSPYLFNGKELDEETGLYYYGSRYYNPRESVWLSVDPLAEMTGTPYQYAYQNPVKLIDPEGMAPESPDGWIEETDKNGKKTYTYDKNVSTVSQAKNAGYKNVTGVSETKQLSQKGKSVTLNANGTASFKGKIVAGNFTLEDGTVVHTGYNSVIDPWDGDRGFWGNLSYSDNIVKKFAYDIPNNAYVALQTFNPVKEDFYNLDNTRNSDPSIAFASTFVTFVAPFIRSMKYLEGMAEMPQGITVFDKLNAAQFSHLFKGTVISSASPMWRGFFNRSLNKGIQLINSKTGSGSFVFPAANTAGKEVINK